MQLVEYYSIYTDTIVSMVGLFVLRINVQLAIFQPYLDLEAGNTR